MVDHERQVLEQIIRPERIERMERVLDARLVGVCALVEDTYKQQNMTACIRTLEAMGIQNVHVIEGDAPFVPNRKITQGCEKWVDLHHHADPEAAAIALRAQGYRVLATSLDAERTIDELDFTAPAALCFGNELAGISPELADLADERFRVPMHGFTQSFNLSVALGICMHTASEARRRAIGARSDLTPPERAALRARWLRLLRKGSDEVVRALSRRPVDG